MSKTFDEWWANSPDFRARFSKLACEKVWNAAIAAAVSILTTWDTSDGLLLGDANAVVKAVEELKVK